MPENSAFLKLEEFYSQSGGHRGDFNFDHKIVHCLNPFPAKPGSEHYRAQSVTFESMKIARVVAKALSPALRVEHVAAKLENEELPEDFEFDHVVTLDRSVLDIKEFKKPRNLPLVLDVLNAAPVNPDDILVFTNVDIGVMPNFYTLIEDLFRRKADSVIINRRTISDVFQDTNDMQIMFSEVGIEHPGFDCFAFRAALLDAFVPFNSCIGIQGVDLPIVYNLLAYAKAPAVLLDVHATFHIGNPETWRSKDYRDYSDFNKAEKKKVASKILDVPDDGKRLFSRLQSSPPFVITREMRTRLGEQPAGKPSKVRRILRNRIRKICAALEKI